MMMKKIRRTTKFKIDLKVVELLVNEMPLPKEIRPHALSGNYNGSWECHVENDSLLIWIETSELGEETIVLSRFGSHSELF